MNTVLKVRLEKMSVKMNTVLKVRLENMSVSVRTTVSSSLESQENDFIIDSTGINLQYLHSSLLSRKYVNAFSWIKLDFRLFYCQTGVKQSNGKLSL